jgi:uncharacterized protein YcbX
MAPTVMGLWRYPVKSLQGEPAGRLRLTARGVEGDRQWAIVDAGSGRALSAKTVPALLEASAQTIGGGADGSGVEVTLPDGTTLVAGEAGCDAVLSDWLGRAVRLVPATGGASVSYDMTFDPPNDDAELVEIPMPPESFVDLAPIHLLTTGSLETAARARPESDWDVRRFRPNLLVATADGDYPEDAWVGRELVAGGAGIHVIMRTVRCAMPLRAQPRRPGGAPLPRDVEVFRTLTRLHDNHLGAYAEVTGPGTVAVGDRLTVSEGGSRSPGPG